MILSSRLAAPCVLLARRAFSLQPDPFAKFAEVLHDSTLAGALSRALARSRASSRASSPIIPLPTRAAI